MKLFNRLVPERPRWLHRLYAWYGAYPWLQCPVCRGRFGSHEWRDIDGNSSVIPDLERPAGSTRTIPICPPCTRAGRGIQSPVWSLIMDHGRTYTLEEAAAELARQECEKDGHDYSVISTRSLDELAGHPLNVKCDRCGFYWQVGEGSRVDARFRP